MVSLFSIPRCRKKHALREFPLDEKVIETCVICSENHEMKICPSIPGLNAIFQEETISNPAESLFFNSRIPWQGQKNQGFNNQMYMHPPPNWNSW